MDPGTQAQGDEPQGGCHRFRKDGLPHDAGALVGLAAETIMITGRVRSQRQLRIGELLRHALAELFSRGELRDPDLSGTSLTVLEVSVSPDLKNARAFVMPLGGVNTDRVMAALERSSRHIRAQLARRVELKYMPEMHFTLDTSFEHSEAVDRLLKDPRVARDLGKRDR